MLDPNAPAARRRNQSSRQDHSPKPSRLRTLRSECRS